MSRNPHNTRTPADIPRPSDVRRQFRRLKSLLREKHRESFEALDGVADAIVEDTAADLARAEDIVAGLFV